MNQPHTNKMRPVNIYRPHQIQTRFGLDGVDTVLKLYGFGRFACWLQVSAQQFGFAVAQGFARQFHAGWTHALAIYPHFKVQVRASGNACRTHIADFVAVLHYIADFQAFVKTAHVRI